MNILQKGALTVVTAVVVASGLIFLSESSIAESIGENEGLHSKSLNMASGVAFAKNAKQPVSKPERSTGSSIVKENIIKAKIATRGLKNIPIAPPPGPFLDSAVFLKNNAFLPAIGNMPLAPEKSVEPPEAPAVSLNKKVAPKQPKKQIKIPFVPLLPSVILDEPKLEEKIMIPPVAPTLRSAPSFNLKKMPVAPQNHGQKPTFNPTATPVWKQKITPPNMINYHSGMNPTSCLTTYNSKTATQKINKGQQQYVYVPYSKVSPNYLASHMSGYNMGESMLRINGSIEI